MLISDEHFAKFKAIYKEEFGEEAYNKMTEQQLLESAIKLITLMKAVYEPMTKTEFDSIQERRKLTMDKVF